MDLGNYKPVLPALICEANQVRANQGYASAIGAYGFQTAKVSQAILATAILSVYFLTGRRFFY